MPVFERRTLVPHDRSTVFSWFSRPGALVRLTPPFAGSVRREPEGLDVGSVARLGVGAPGSLGLGLESAAGLAKTVLPFRLPQWFAPEAPWTSLHTALEPGRMFRDEMSSGPLRSWVHTHSFEDAAPGEADTAGGRPGCVVVDHIEYELPAGAVLRRTGAAWSRAGRWTEERLEDELARQFDFRAAQLAGDLDFHAGLHAAPDADGPLTIAVSGASGLIGSQLCALLTGGGHRVIRLVRTGSRGTATSSGETVSWDPAAGHLDAEALRDVDAVVNLSGETIGGRLTEAHRDEMLQSRLSATGLLARTLAELAEDGRQRSLINASAIGFYGAEAGAGQDGEGLRETDQPGEDFLAVLCRQWEQATAPAARAGVRTALIRTGLVLTPAGGILQQVLPLFLLGIGGPLGTGKDRNPWQSWISIEDIVGLFAHAALDGRVHGPVNGVAPRPVQSRDFAATLGTVLRRPSAVPLPAAAPTAVLGSEGNRLLVEADQKARADRALDCGYVFRHPQLDAALQHVLGR
ncbi:TIGR01777 family oxidoreductase [Citricoccus sp. NPDC055426]|uniref:TIGR01777 family oxidoreductase n=1 Tax=Citricoccus sp. NPDC055426 TaxID=3155536 RepID=UPI00342D77A4